MGVYIYIYMYMPSSPEISCWFRWFAGQCKFLTKEACLSLSSNRRTRVRTSEKVLKKSWVAIACERDSSTLTHTCSKSLRDWKGWPPRFWNWGMVTHPGWQAKLCFCSLLCRSCYTMIQNFLFKKYPNMLPNFAALQKFGIFESQEKF